MNFNYNSPIFNRINIPNIHFRSVTNPPSEGLTARQDSFATNPVYANFADKNAIIQAAKSNPKIMNILSENNLLLNINYDELERLRSGHLMDTRVIAAKMYSALPNELKSEVNLSDLQQAAMFHDYGKVFIPEKILNKNDKLNDKEKKIMELHSELGYELLSNQGVNDNVLKLIKYHHQKPDGSGYPAITDGYKPDISSQVLCAADKYTALREKRSYKDALSREESLNIIRQDVDEGIISPEVYDALEKVV